MDDYHEDDHSPQVQTFSVPDKFKSKLLHLADRLESNFKEQRYQTGLSIVLTFRQQVRKERISRRMFDAMISFCIRTHDLKGLDTLDELRDYEYRILAEMTVIKEDISDKLTNVTGETPYDNELRQQQRAHRDREAKKERLRVVNSQPRLARKRVKRRFGKITKDILRRHIVRAVEE